MTTAGISAKGITGKNTLWERSTRAAHFRRAGDR
jgi:hypothetical protein